MMKPKDHTKIAIERRLELQTQIKAMIKEIEEIEVFLRVTARMSVAAASAPTTQPTQAPQPAEPVAPPLARMALHGEALELFTKFARDVILAAGHPLKTSEIVDLLRERGNPIGGTNEWKTASNRLWQAKDAGALIHMIGVGYWPTDIEYSPAEHARPQKQKQKQPRVPRKIGSHRPVSKTRGRPKLLSEEQILAAEAMQKDGKTNKEIGLLLGGVSYTTIYNALRDLEQKRAVEAAEKSAVEAPKSLN